MKRRAAKPLLLGGAAAALVAAIAAGAWWYPASRGPAEAAGREIERYASAATGTNVRLERIEISSADGSGTITAFAVRNPGSFRTRAAFSAGAIKLALDPASLGKEVLVVRALSVNSPRLSYETSGDGSNYDALLANVRRYAGEPAARTPPRKLIVDRLVIRDATLSYASPLTAGETVTIPLTDVRLSGIGRNEGGITPGQFAQAIVEALLDRIRRAKSLEARGGTPGR